MKFLYWWRTKLQWNKRNRFIEHTSSSSSPSVNILCAANCPSSPPELQWKRPPVWEASFFRKSTAPLLAQSRKLIMKIISPKTTAKEFLKTPQKYFIETNRLEDMIINSCRKCRPCGNYLCQNNLPQYHLGSTDFWQ